MPLLNPPTMKNVADLVGVSKQTVSAVINGKSGIPLETQERVWNAIKQLGYRPYAVARSLRTRQTHTIALVVPDIANPSFATIASAAEDFAHSRGYNLALYNTHDDVEREARYIEMASQRWVDGMLFVSAADEMTALADVERMGIPTVAIDRIPSGYYGPAVTLDNFEAGRIAARHLVGLGHTRLAHISGPLSLRLARERLQGFREALQARGLVLPPTHCPEGSWQPASGYQAACALLAQSSPPTAIFAANDRMAMGAIQAIQAAGLRVPGDISVIGLDDIELAAYHTPQLTTIRQSFAEMATTAVQILLARIAGNPPDPPQRLITPELVERQSSGPAPQAPK